MKGKNEKNENNINNINNNVNNDENNQLRNRKESEKKEGNEVLQEEEDKSKVQNKYETINVLNNRLIKLKRILPFLWCVFSFSLIFILFFTIKLLIIYKKINNQANNHINKIIKTQNNNKINSTLLYIAGLASLVFYPTNMIANTTYVSENALLPSFSELQFPEEYSIKAQRYTSEYLEHLREYQVKNHSIIEGFNEEEPLPSLSQWIADWVEIKLRSIRLSNVYQHKFISADGVRFFYSYFI